jgi:hypothetical protein
MSTSSSSCGKRNQHVNDIQQLPFGDGINPTHKIGYFGVGLLLVLPHCI